MFLPIDGYHLNALRFGRGPAFVERCVPEPDQEHIKAFGRKILLRAEPESAARMLEMYFADSSPLALEEISVPTLILHGSADVIVPLAVAEMAHAVIPDNELVVFEGAGHVPSMTRPREVVAAIDDWAARRSFR
jgi:pimeloyl-ACP methyl ester carboxylesterase